MTEDLCTAIVELDALAVPAIVTRRLEAGEDALEILEDSRRGMIVVGERFREGEYFLAELIISAELFKKAVALLDPELAKARSSEVSGKVVLATMKGDIHDLGKNILTTLLQVHAFEVHDLGVDVEPREVIEKVREVTPDFVGFSSLITSSYASTKQAVEMLEAEGLRDGLQILLGGGVTTADLKEYVGADFQTLDAAAGVAFCLEQMAGE